MASVIAAGLFWRSGVIPLSPFLHKYGGDALWAMLIFLGVGFLGNVASGGDGVLFCCAVEFTQLYHAPWIESVRSTRLGALVLGATFNWPDLIAYGVGIIFGCLAENLLCRGTK